MEMKRKPEMRRTDRQLKQEEIERILRENTYGVLSTVCEDGYPYGLPINYAYENGKLYFHHAAQAGLLGENAARGEAACFTVTGKTEVLPEQFSTKYESVIAFGRLRESTEKEAVLMRLVKRFSPDFLEQGRQYVQKAADHVKVYEFEIEQATGKARR